MGFQQANIKSQRLTKLIVSDKHQSVVTTDTSCLLSNLKAILYPLMDSNLDLSIDDRLFVSEVQLQTKIGSNNLALFQNRCLVFTFLETR